MLSFSFKNWLNEEIIPQSQLQSAKVFAQSGFSQSEIETLKNSGATIMTAYEYFDKCSKGGCPGSGGYSLGLTTHITSVYDIGTHFEDGDKVLMHWKNAYDLHMGSRAVATDKFMTKITDEGKTIVFFVPSRNSPQNKAGVTESEISWYLKKAQEEPQRLKSTIFVFGAYDLLDSDVYKSHIKGDVAKTAGILKNPSAHVIPGETPNNAPPYEPDMQRHLNQLSYAGADVNNRFRRWDTRQGGHG